MCSPAARAPPPATAAHLARLTDAELHNLYGPTEAAVDVTYHQYTSDDINLVPIGRPVANTGVHVFDARLRPVPPNVAGELYLTGVQLARGYVGAPTSVLTGSSPTPPRAADGCTAQVTSSAIDTTANSSTSDVPTSR